MLLSSSVNSSPSISNGTLSFASSPAPKPDGGTSTFDTLYDSWSLMSSMSSWLWRICITTFLFALSMSFCMECMAS